ncbi:olfactory receptor 6V1-like [Hippopotamus amphibius kiboko]|uniref:olfactory receptor 6V1-like n=1 Tax=Hippopotamus amphibius kiboko TaxID=575201 RepID=UPI002599C287|nr:olfactory receptor 6V1-like [Hippopotamus amphibius kiboko]
MILIFPFSLSLSLLLFITDHLLAFLCSLFLPLSLSHSQWFSVSVFVSPSLSLVSFPCRGPSPQIMAHLSHPSQFVLLGFSSFGELQILLYRPFLALYLLAFTGNTLIIVPIVADAHLHTPRYFFLGNFSLLEILVTMTAVPRMLSDLRAPHKIISFTGCMVQFYFYFSLGSTSFLILSDMSLDRFVAIRHPLRYGTLMSGDVCARLAGAAWAAPFLAMVRTVLSRADLSYCHGNVINHFFCDNAPLLQLSCSDTSLLEFWDFVMALAFVLSSFLVTLVSYGYIVCTVLRIPSASGRQKTFSTCGSHLTLVFIGYSSTIFLYVQPGKADSVEINKTVALVTSILTPFLNPFILTLRNETFKTVLHGQMQRLKGLLQAL